MFVFGINLPVTELLFVVLLLFIVAMAFIIVQLVKLGRHVRVLDDTTLEIRRYEEAEEVTLRAMETETEKLKPSEKKRVQELYGAAAKLEGRVVGRLLAGEEPAEVKRDLMGAGIAEHAATRIINNASYWIDKTAALLPEDAKDLSAGLKGGAKK